MIWGDGEAEYFCGDDWTTQIGLKLFSKLLLARTVRLPRSDCSPDGLVADLRGEAGAPEIEVSPAMIEAGLAEPA